MSNPINDFARKQSAEPQPDVQFLAKTLAERFPEEAASADLSNPEGVVRLAVELLHRLWRWEK